MPRLVVCLCRQHRAHRSEGTVDEIEAVPDIGGQRAQFDEDRCGAGISRPRVKEVGRAGVGIGTAVTIDQPGDLEGVCGWCLAECARGIVRSEGQERLSREDEKIARLSNRPGRCIDERAIIQIVTGEPTAIDSRIIAGIDQESAATGQVESAWPCQVGKHRAVHDDRITSAGSGQRRIAVDNDRVVARRAAVQNANLRSGDRSQRDRAALREGKAAAGPNFERCSAGTRIDKSV